MSKGGEGKHGSAAENFQALLLVLSLFKSSDNVSSHQKRSLTKRGLSPKEVSHQKRSLVDFSCITAPSFLRYVAVGVVIWGLTGCAPQVESDAQNVEQVGVYVSGSTQQASVQTSSEEATQREVLFVLDPQGADGSLLERNVAAVELLKTSESLSALCKSTMGYAKRAPFAWCNVRKESVKQLPRKIPGAKEIVREEEVSGVYHTACNDPEGTKDRDVGEVAADLLTTCANRADYYAEGIPIGQSEGPFVPHDTATKYWTLGLNVQSTPIIRADGKYIAFVNGGNAGTLQGENICTDSAVFTCNLDGSRHSTAS